MTSTDTVPNANSLGSGAQNPPSSNPTTFTDPDDVSDAAALNDPSLPEQLHSGRVGYGPNYHTGPVRSTVHLEALANTRTANRHSRTRSPG